MSRESTGKKGRRNHAPQQYEHVVCVLFSTDGLLQFPRLGGLSG